MTSSALISAEGYVAPRHMKAIKALGGRDFVYLAAVVGVYSRHGSIMIESRVLHRGNGGGLGEARQARDIQHGQGSQFTCTAFSSVLIENGIAISMDGKGSWRDNVFS
jgi:putative transposase